VFLVKAELNNKNIFWSVLMSNYSDIIEVQALAGLLGDSEVIIVDCRFSLADEDAGRQAYQNGHISTAQYVHLDRDLCGSLTPTSGRHPLPSIEAMTHLFSRLGISSGKQVVAYDDTSGIAASRFWWMLRYLGHDEAAVLNGGMPAWKAAGLPLNSGVEKREFAKFSSRPRAELLVLMDDVEDQRLIVDSRLPERFRGEFEPIDPVAGHIPGAVNFFYKNNFDEHGRLLSPSVIREQFETVLGEVPPAEAVFYCGSGVTACNNLLALAYVGLGDGKHYVGSWSEWCRNPGNQIVLGE
jgi:thiosulfate/3-mercaptopyruvate sulfurtransferase